VGCGVDWGAALSGKTRYLSLNLVEIPRSSSYSSSSTYLALGVPTLGLLVILYIDTIILGLPSVLSS
jgi:hypothetical protein